MEKHHPLSPNEWGNNCWRFLHASSFAWPEKPSVDQRESAKCFYENLGNMLPCPRCRKHYKAHIRKNPPKVRSREELSMWLVDLHNEVNRSQGRPEIDYGTVKRHYLENSHEMRCETQYVQYLEDRLEKKDIAMKTMCAIVAILAIVMVSKALRRRTSLP